MTHPAGFLPNGNGPKGATFGRDPASGRAFKRDGTVRAERKVQSFSERMAALREAEAAMFASNGRKVLKATPLAAGASTMRRYVREANAYATPERVEARRAYFQRMLASIDGKAIAARSFLAKHGTLAATLDDIYARVGHAAQDAIEASNGADIDPQDIVAKVLSADDMATLQKGTDPALDPFASFRKDAPEAPEADDDDSGDDDSGDDDSNA